MISRYSHKKELMKTGKKIFMAMAAAVALGCLVLVSCKKEPEPEPDFSDYDSLGFEITDSITVHFGDERWTTLEYSAYIEHEEISGFDWIYVTARKPGSTYPYINMKFFEGEGVHTGTLAINDPGIGYTIPGELTGDAKCGNVRYFEKCQVTSPDGTKTSDWLPLNIRMQVLKYVDSTHQATAYITGTLYDYKSWVNREVTNVEDAEVREFTITFGDLPVGNHN